MTQTKKQKSRIPEFKSYEEEAEWWDTHSVADYLEEFKTVELEVDRSLFHTLSIRLDAETLTKVRKEAQKKGLGATTLIRVWVREKLEELEKKKQEERKHQYPATP
jgi:predicted DNA binding CopG/RHH family protein